MSLYLGMKLPLEYGVTPQKKADPPFSSTHQLLVAPELGMELCHLLPHLCWDFGWRDLLQGFASSQS